MSFKKQVAKEQIDNRVIINWNDELKETYYLLLHISPIDSLIKYVNDSDASIRCSIFSGIAGKKPDKEILQEIYNKHLDDTARFSTCNTDIVFSYKVNEYMEMYINLYDSIKPIDYGERLEKIKKRTRIFLNGESIHEIKFGENIIEKEELLKSDSLTVNNKWRIISFNLRTKENELSI